MDSCGAATFLKKCPDNKLHGLHQPGAQKKIYICSNTCTSCLCKFVKMTLKLSKRGGEKEKIIKPLQLTRRWYAKV